MAIFKTSAGQALTIPEEGEFFRDPSDIYGRKIYQRKAGQVKSYDIFGLAGGQASGEHASQAAQRGQQLLQSQYGVNFTNLPTYNLGDVMSAFSLSGAQTAPFTEFQYAKPTAMGETITQELPEYTFKTPLGQQITGVSPLAPPQLNVAPQIPIQQTQISKPYYRVEGKNEVYDVKTGQHITAEQAKNIPNFWQNIETIQKETPQIETTRLSKNNLSDTTPIDISGTQSVKESSPSAVSASARQTIQSIQDTISALTPSTPKMKEIDELTAKMSELLGQTTGETKALAEEEQKAGIPEITRQFKNIQNEIAIKTAEYEKLYADIEGKPITMSSILGQQAQARKMAQADIGYLQARALALQNNLTFAQQTAQKAVDAKYNPIEEELRIKQAQLSLLLPIVEKEEKRQATALQLFYQQEQQRISDQKAEEQRLVNYTLNQIDSYKDAGIRIGDSYETIQQKILTSPSYKLSIQPKLETTTTDITEYNFAKNQGYTGTFTQWQKEQANLKNVVPKTTTETRDTNITQYLQSKKGTDGYISAQSYQEGLKKYIAQGGTQSNFFASFPQQTYLRQLEIDKLPAAIKPQLTTSKSDLTPDQLSIINDAKAAIDQVKQNYGDWGATRQRIIDMSKQQYNFDISPYI